MAFYDLKLWLGTPVDLPDLDLGDMVADVVSKNELSYNASPSRANDMTLINDQEAYYVPTVEFTLNDVSTSDFCALMQMVNSRGFVVQYHDQEMGETVYRSMYATEQSIDALLHAGASLYGVNGVKVKFVSRYGYPYTPRSSANCTVENKYHMYELHAHAARSNFLPMSHTMGEENYV